MKELQLKIWWAVSLVMLWPMIRAVIVESTRLLTCRHSGNFLHLCCQGVLDAPRCVISLQFCYHQYSSLFIRVGFSISKRCSSIWQLESFYIVIIQPKIWKRPWLANIIAVAFFATTMWPGGHSAWGLMDCCCHSSHCGPPLVHLLQLKFWVLS